MTTFKRNMFFLQLYMMEVEDRECGYKHPLRLTLQGLCIYSILSTVQKKAKYHEFHHKQNCYHHRRQTRPFCLSRRAFILYLRDGTRDLPHYLKFGMPEGQLPM
jgi:hypothetical protein